MGAQRLDKEDGVFHRHALIGECVPEEDRRHVVVHLFFQGEEIPQLLLPLGQQVLRAPPVAKWPHGNDRIAQHQAVGTVQLGWAVQRPGEEVRLPEHPQAGGQVPPCRGSLHHDAPGVHIPLRRVTADEGYGVCQLQKGGGKACRCHGVAQHRRMGPHGHTLERNGLPLPVGGHGISAPGTDDHHGPEQPVIQLLRIVPQIEGQLCRGASRPRRDLMDLIIHGSLAPF